MRKPTMWFSNRSKCTNRAVTAKLICAFVFAYAKYWFSQDVAHMLVDLGFKRSTAKVIMVTVPQFKDTFEKVKTTRNPGSNL